MIMLDVKNVSKKFEHFQLDNVSFQVPQGYIMGFIGINGAGKTTTIKSILNLITVDSGEIQIMGKNVAIHEAELKQSIGYAFGNVDFYTRSRIRTLTKVVKTFYDNWDDEAYRRYVRKFKLIEDKRIAELSTGMKVKYSLAIALSHGAKLLILDEPTSGLDPAARDDLLDIFRELVQDGEISILFSTHITSDLEKCADYITYIHEGRIVGSAEKDEFIDTYRLVNGKVEELEGIKERLISHRVNSFGFTGLIRADELPPSAAVNVAIPNLEEIMVYYSKKEAAHV
ncbi:ABC transporter ATP-binding protein [Saccharibacillus alkalitolerans]|uniref:ABC transporter ATP-binding protein n=1 Tax=Saccharibacillus alkalitolerans TaxID=2705290 RepID=A0ABX0F1C2_9BACL|nr:ABC transporter ATP-binding protein [Saccharibacillus alkalitolerans]NGZ74686.1 ABC transporter ATP-binding protein [Saccharibacillus alkalitolerans]